MHAEKSTQLEEYALLMHITQSGPINALSHASTIYALLEQMVLLQPMAQTE
jgi:hypothetical protein